MQQIAEITPNAKKLCILSSIEIVIVSALIIGFIIYLDSIVNFDSLFQTFQQLGAPKILASSFLSWFVIIAAVLTAAVLVLNYLALGKVRYVFYEDQLACYNNFLIMQISEIIIPYKNIIGVSVDKPNTVNNADITIEMTGMKKKSQILKFIDNAAEVAGEIQKILDNYRANYYAKYAQEYRLQQIAEDNY